jgi:hypothetical protein
MESTYEKLKQSVSNLTDNNQELARLLELTRMDRDRNMREKESFRKEVENIQ